MKLVYEQHYKVPGSGVRTVVKTWGDVVCSPKRIVTQIFEEFETDVYRHHLKSRVKS